MRPERTYRFTIINLMKPSSLYNQGMKPVFYSEVNAKKNKVIGVSWDKYFLGGVKLLHGFEKKRYSQKLLAIQLFSKLLCSDKQIKALQQFLLLGCYVGS